MTEKDPVKLYRNARNRQLDELCRAQSLIAEAIRVLRADQGSDSGFVTCPGDIIDRLRSTERWETRRQVYWALKEGESPW